MNGLGKALLGLAVAAAAALSLLGPDAKRFQTPELARIFFWHFPCTIACTLLLFWGAWNSLRYLQTRNPQADVFATAAIELSLLFGLLVMATGILFSRVQWGAWWQQDPRQTSFLLVLLILMAQFVLRSATPEGPRRAALSAAYWLAATLPIVFLMFVFPRLPQIANASFHPSDTIQQGQLDPYYRWTVISMLAVILMLAAWLYRLRVRAGLAELALEEFDGELEADRGGSAAT
ncbi:MAG: cytochrome c biogenesis protein CcsA, partial [Fimbriimonas ginsengisoli]|nr:cytochrome c biogenesis protein CcsA [Fimbriimonas ginsengisoli]